MPETPANKLLTEAKALELFAGLFIDITKAPYNVVFDAPIWTDDIVTANTAGLRLAAKAPGFVRSPSGWCEFLGDVEIGTHTYFNATGIGATTFKINAKAPRGAQGFIFPATTTEAGASGFTIDGNEANRTDPTGQGGVHGSNIVVMNSTAINVEKIKSINAVNHCFDITTPVYGDAGDGAIIPDPSEQISVTDCIAKGYGDDGFTTHGSGLINFTRCRALGTRHTTDTAYVNSNGFEFDDYSYNVTATDCYATGSAHGFEIKAHGNMSAASNVRLIGCVSERNETNYSLRHIGHHVEPVTHSLTAKNVQLVGCTSRYPRRVFFGGVDNPDGDVADDQTPPGKQYHGMVIGAYRGVTITNYHDIGDPTYDYAGSSAILVHFLAEDVTMTGYHIEGYTTCGWDIYSTGGSQPAQNVTLSHGVHRDSAVNGISTGGASAGLISSITMTRNVPGSANGTGIRAYGTKNVRSCGRVTGYAPNFSISDTAFSVYETPMATNVLA